ncbi:HSP82 [Hepatospora eriocheir]|uniref:HSP82 n=1 Tax=Hepatospora eriocheir TaxID=1081669 RepID=A0A1X0QLK0_9MICR|nr:HSP82 [Hepatospora eriocheir]
MSTDNAEQTSKFNSEMIKNMQFNTAEKGDKKAYTVNDKSLFEMLSKNTYKDKDVFLREIISNASDAIQKLVASKTKLDDEGYETEMYGNLQIDLYIDKVNNRLIVRDNGIGMTRENLINYLGRIAQSGTAEFKKENEKKSVNDDLIGNFGVGFYSMFMIADRIDLITKNPRDKAYIWSSNNETGFNIMEYDGEFQKHGTVIYMSVKESELEYLEESKISEIVKKNSSCINYPIVINTEKQEKKEEDKDKEVEEIEEDNKEKIVKESKILNEGGSIWSKKFKSIPKEELQSFYKLLSKDVDDYVYAESFNYEGVNDMKLMIFFPKRSRSNFFESGPSEKANNVTIYSNNVMITNEISREYVPAYMDFITAAVSSPSLRLNVSREFIQGTALFEMIKSKLPRSIYRMFSNLQDTNPTLFNELYKEYSHYLKLAVKDTRDSVQTDFAKLLKFPCNYSDEEVTLDSYILKAAEINPNSKQILFLSGTNTTDVKNSIFLDAFKDKPVIYMTSVTDEIMLQGFKTYNGFDFQSIAVEGVEGHDNENSEELKSLVDHIKEHLKDSVDKVIVSSRYESIPAVVLASKYGASSTMEKLLKNNVQTENNIMAQMLLRVKKIIEINPNNKAIIRLKELFDKNEIEQVNKLIDFIFTTALIGSGYQLEKTGSYAKDVFGLFNENF